MCLDDLYYTIDIFRSQMLANGVDMIIEQVVNPKIYSVFKPAIDSVVCEHLNIDQNVRALLSICAHYRQACVYYSLVAVTNISIFWTECVSLCDFCRFGKRN